ncbi:hypothetical protein IEQ34_015356 [Dendrobium chrysotoxum]|uniref:Uncharacterized protein n=1 Tax=Dendrobium chrysotoxum TaxID=161865 RepID=A0AAV7G0F1_DENCH|nr:hypothetical protein IEQ34_015356 [Dendrobium chrysotoxum]
MYLAKLTTRYTNSTRSSAPSYKTHLRGLTKSPTHKNPPEPEVYNDEYIDWSHGLLAIGTLKSSFLREEEQMHSHPTQSSHSTTDMSDFTIDEVMKLQKELTKLLKSKSKSCNNGSETGKEKANLPLNKLLNCPSNLHQLEEIEDGADTGDLSPNSMIILKKARDLLAQNRSTIKQKSICFLLKKIFVCKSGFAPASSLRDPIIVSSMEKLLRIIVYKKIFPQSSAAVAVKKYLENKLSEEVAGKEKSEEKEGRRFKWDKTDSDFIVLEIELSHFVQLQFFLLFVIQLNGKSQKYLNTRVFSLQEEIHVHPQHSRNSFNIKYTAERITLVIIRERDCKPRHFGEVVAEILLILIR